MKSRKQMALALFLSVPLVAAAQSAVPLSGIIGWTGRFTSLTRPTSGTVVVFQNRDGRTHLLLHRFKTQSDQNLQVWLYKNVPRRGDQNLAPSGSALKLGELTQFGGDFEFALPSGVDMLAGYKSVVIWNDQVKRVFGVAPLE
ncbi:DM13 domain-containing protein [Deinococcus deserti]|nr:DM13 domain-containing protein [Deinococcus deserti]